MRQHWTKEQKAEFWAAFTAHRDEGCNIREAYRLAYADLKAQGKEVPGLHTFQNWYHKAMHAVRGPMDDTTAESPAADPEADAPEEAAEEAAPEPDDYTARLQMIVLLYRRRSEQDCDAVCDRLLPELTEE